MEPFNIFFYFFSAEWIIEMADFYRWLFYILDSACEEIDKYSNNNDKDM